MRILITAILIGILGLIVVFTSSGPDEITEFKYKDHDYIKFENATGRSAGVVHSPDCKTCLDKFE